MDIKYHAFYIFKIFPTDIHVAMYRLVAATPNRRASKFPVEAILAALPKRASDNDARLVCRTHATCCSIVRPKGKTIEDNNLRKMVAKKFRIGEGDWLALTHATYFSRKRARGDV